MTARFSHSTAPTTEIARFFPDGQSLGQPGMLERDRSLYKDYGRRELLTQFPSVLHLEIQASVEGEHSVASVGGILREDAGAAGSAGQRDQAEVWTRQTKRGLQKSEGIVLHLTGIS